MPSLRQGESRVLEFTILNEAGSVTNLTGYTVTWRLGRKFADSFVLEKLTTVLSPLNGLISVSLTSDETSLTAGTYTQELLLEGGGTSLIVFRSSLLIQKSLFV